MKAKISFLLLLTSNLWQCQPPTQQPGLFPGGTWVDLTYPYDENTLYWPTSALFSKDTVFEGVTEGGFYYAAYKFCTAEHGGTHLDAPIHFAEGRKTVDQLTLDQLIGPAMVIDVSETALTDRDYQVTVEDLEGWEAKYGPIPEASIVLIRTGYGRYWPDAEKYMGTAERGQEAVAQLHFPGLHPGAASWLVQNRSIKAIGIDTPSIDFGQSQDFKTHQILFAENIPAFENVAYLDKLPTIGSWLLALPMKIKGGSGGPVRIAGFIPDQLQE